MPIYLSKKSSLCRYILERTIHRSIDMLFEAITLQE